MEPLLKAGRYQIEEKIGEGGMSIVYLARDSRLDCRVALKEIKPELLGDRQYRVRLAQEAKAAAAINHPSIARSLDYVDDGTDVFVVYEFVEGVTLREQLARASLSMAEILELSMKIAEALQAAHEQGFVHRDIKPENIMLTARAERAPDVKILDFGLTKRVLMPGLGPDAMTSLTVSIDSGKVILGTLPYMSPEQVRAETIDLRTDIYSLGLMIYEMATGTNPFYSREPTEIIARIYTHEPAPIRDRNPISPPELESIVRRCLRKKREDRYGSVFALYKDLKGLLLALDGRAATTTAPTPDSQTPTQLPRGVARALFLVTQLGFLVMYGLAYHYLPRNIERLSIFGVAHSVLALVFFMVMLLGAVVHVYFLSSVGFDYKDSGRLFRQVFVPLLVLDSIWSTVPLLMFKELEWEAWLCVVLLAFLPFSQRALIHTAYAPRGGKTSGIRASITV